MPVYPVNRFCDLRERRSLNRPRESGFGIPLSRVIPFVSHEKYRPSFKTQPRVSRSPPFFSDYFDKQFIEGLYARTFTRVSRGVISVKFSGRIRRIYRIGRTPADDNIAAAPHRPLIDLSP